MFHTHYRVRPAKLAPGVYRNITGNEATALGFLTASKLADRQLFYGSYPITPASDILHQLSGYKTFGVKTFQAEDEIAAIGAAIGALYGGALALTASSGPGIALKTEAMGLAVMVELPLVVIDVQRAGPSTGMPTKTEQADLLQVMFGRNCDSPLPIVAPATPGECFDLAIEACRLALKYMTPVVFLSDAFLATGSEPWRIPAFDDLPADRRPERDRPRDVPAVPARPGDARPAVGRARARRGSSTASAVSRRPTSPATSATTRTTTTGCSCYRQAKVAGIADDIPPLDVFGPDHGDLLILGWGSTYGAIRSAVETPAGGRRSPSPTPTCATSTRSRPTPRTVLRQLPPGAHPGGQPRPAADARSGPATSSTPSATTRSAASRSASRRSSTRPIASSREGATHDRDATGTRPPHRGQPAAQRRRTPPSSS